MVNETNKTQQSLENEELGQRLTASNQALADMQAEHRQLLEEMKNLRKRAEDLQRLRDEQQREEEEKRLECERNEPKAASIVQLNEDAPKLEKTFQETEETNSEETDPAEAEYIKEKLAEIARLKAQFKRVQHMINTTELIENHISKSETSDKESANETNSSESKPETTTSVEPTSAEAISNIIATDPQLMNIPKMPSMVDLTTATTSDEKEQLILTMLNMFQDFSSDLKLQADNLRAERERIKELKESIIRSRKEQHK